MIHLTGKLPESAQNADGAAHARRCCLLGVVPGLSKGLFPNAGVVEVIEALKQFLKTSPMMAPGSS